MHQAFEGAGQDDDLVVLVLMLLQAGPAQGAESGFDEFLITFLGQALDVGGVEAPEIGLVVEATLRVQGQFLEKRQGLPEGEHPAPEEKGEEQPFGGKADKGSVDIEDGGNSGHGWVGLGEK